MKSDLLDFPYYDGTPVAISCRQWLIVMAAIACGFLVLTSGPPIFATRFGQFIPAILFSAIPLTVLAVITPRHWTALFRRVRLRDVMWMFAFALLNIVVSMMVGFATVKTLGANANAAVVELAGMSAPDATFFFLKTAIQLFGEEVLTVLPFLALLTGLHTRMQMARTPAILGAWLLSALMFGAVHLPTYQWNLVQCIVVIGSARLVLTLPYLLTKNIWVSTGTHIINDWLLFAMSLLGPHLMKFAMPA
jgi:uncharacterized protein